MGILWTVIIGFVAGVIAKFIHPGSNEPAGFIVTTLLGIAGAFVATYLGQALGWYRPGEGAGLIGAVLGALVGASSRAAIRDQPLRRIGCWRGDARVGDGPEQVGWRFSALSESTTAAVARHSLTLACRALAAHF
jgi:uncharacterized membrane protein YeaQ/YmgE (transglycosylase-associated protein family)